MSDSRVKDQKVLNKFENFIAKFRGMSFARTERFECQFQFPNALEGEWNKIKSDPMTTKSMPQNVSGGTINTGGTNSASAPMEAALLCEEVQIPGMVLTNKEVPLGNWNFMRNNNVNFLGNEINITFLTDRHWQLRHLFEAWIDLCVDTTSKQVAYPDDTHGIVWINSLDLQNNVTASWELMEVTPKVLNLIPLAMGGVSVARTTLIISSAYWRSRTIDIDLNKDIAEKQKAELDPRLLGYAAYTNQIDADTYSRWKKYKGD